jgi:hypothetical protein
MTQMNGKMCFTLTLAIVGLVGLVLPGTVRAQFLISGWGAVESPLAKTRIDVRRAARRLDMLAPSILVGPAARRAWIASAGVLLAVLVVIVPEPAGRRGGSVRAMTSAAPISGNEHLIAPAAAPASRPPHGGTGGDPAGAEPEPPTAAAPAPVAAPPSFLAGRMPRSVDGDGSQVFDGIPCRIRQPDGTFRDELWSVKVRPLPKSQPVLDE